ncbi:DNA-binding transcriptional regulator, AcrR family [Nocardiopsis flavescens]|uniref:DNA-binding transcriptional regulator, AcrR family n=1 Tax=Nocardiopsis flavescens TaxID=758803 RepID=A0A1M6FTC1_9ACTN|nr:TetR/AcrR family transcriptional regulator [Nocardiopsis flavescens]SHJ00942.1 DNA-binding transcriptional regulator, AcrR family [Nocardiopsis flavescens]
MSQREDLLAGARRCLVEKGYAKTTARDIAAASGAHLASIGYHFGSKDALMSAAVLEASGEWGDVFERAVRASRAEAPQDRIRVLLTSLLETLPEQRELLVASVQAFGQAQFDEPMRTALAAGIDEGRRELAALILDVPSDGLDPATVAGVGSMVYNLVTGYVLQYLMEPDSLPTAEQALEGLRALTRGR